MGLIRKFTYVGTGGMIDIRSDAELIASYSKKLMKAHEKAGAHAKCDASKVVGP